MTTNIIAKTRFCDRCGMVFEAVGVRRYRCEKCNKSIKLCTVCAGKASECECGGRLKPSGSIIDLIFDILPF